MAAISATCRLCKEETTVTITDDQLRRLNAGDEYIQDILPDVDASIREIFITKTCGTCFDKLFEDTEE